MGGGEEEAKGDEGSRPLGLLAGNRAWIQVMGPRLHESWMEAQTAGVSSEHKPGQILKQADARPNKKRARFLTGLQSSEGSDVKHPAVGGAALMSRQNRLGEVNKRKL